MREDLNVLIQAQYPLIYLVTFEEERAEQTIATVARNLAREQDQRTPLKIYTWTMTRGMVEYGNAGSGSQHNNTVSPEAAVEWVIRQREQEFTSLRTFTHSKTLPPSPAVCEMPLSPSKALQKPLC